MTLFLRRRQRTQGMAVALVLVVLTCFQSVALRAQGESGNLDPGYRLGPGDQIRVHVFNQDDLTGEYVLDGDGRFSMPLIGLVNANGLATHELEARLVDLYRPDYLVNPRISVEVQNYRPYYIIGEVRSPGGYPYVDGITYLNAVAIAGGYTYRAKKDWVWVIPAGEGNDEEIKTDVNERVMPGDIIRVAERIF
jgi:polysaccharide export outer membrane protein